MNCSHIVALNWNGCGSTSAFWFLDTVGRDYAWKASQYATSPASHVARIFDEGGGLDDAWPWVKKHCEFYPAIKGFSSWPYSLFWKQWDSDPDWNAKFIFSDRSAEDWARVEFSFQCMRGVEPAIKQYHVIKNTVYGCGLDYNSTVTEWQAWVDMYKKHSSDIKEYFAGKDNYMYVDIFDGDPLEVANQICDFIDIKNITNFSYPGKTSVGGERSDLIDDTGWDDTFRAKWNEISPYVNW